MKSKKITILRKIILSLIIILIMLIIPALASAKTYHIDLLTISETGNIMTGGLADAYLEVKPGTGRIFLDSFPLTKIDTQISTRYANQVACEYLDQDCSLYDFFYTIRADTTIVGGPSAGAPLTILTIAALEGLELRDDVIMTGTINSGGSIGPVGGVREKALAAQKAGFKTVLVPRFHLPDRLLSNTTNQGINNTNNNTNTTITNTTETQTNDTAPQEGADRPEQETNLSISLIRISNINQALEYYADKQPELTKGEIKVPDKYANTMRDVADNLCARALNLYQDTELEDQEKINKSEEYISNIEKSLEHKDHYSAASYCFSLNLMLRQARLEKIQSREHLLNIYSKTAIAINDFDQRLEKLNLTTFSELETYIIVKERLLEAKESLDNINRNNISAEELGYAIERYYSAVYWSEFFNMAGKEIELDKQYLKQACYTKLAEAEERINYASLYLPPSLNNARKTIDQAYAFALQENYKMCLFKASFAKAESNFVLSSVAVGKDQADELAEEKLKAAERLIIEEQENNCFPILGYSYYEYSKTLKKNQDFVSSLIFAEYSLEISNIEMYFPDNKLRLPAVEYSTVFMVLAALMLGMAAGVMISIRLKKKPVVKKNK